MRIRLERTYPFPVEPVWRAMTDARAIRQWWLDTDFEPVVGREFFFRDRPQGSWDGVTRGTVLEADPPRRVRFTWVGGGLDTTVSYELTPSTEGGTRVVLTHEGFRGPRGLLLGTLLRFGWRGYLGRDLPRLAGHLHDNGPDAAFPEPPKAARRRG